MKKPWQWGLLSLAGFVLLLFALAPLLVGAGVRQATTASMLAMVPPESAAQLRLEETRFDSGWFRSAAEVDLTYYPAGLGESLAGQLHFDIRHGPLLLTPAGPRLGLAHATIRPSYEIEAINAALGQTGLVLPEMRMELLANFDQSLLMSLTLAPIPAGDGPLKIVFDGLHATLAVAADGAAEFRLDMGQLQLTSADLELDLDLEGLQISSSTGQVNDLLAASSTRLSVPALRSSGPLRFSARGLAAESSLTESDAGPQQVDFRQHLEIGELDADWPLAALSWTAEVRELQRELIYSYYELLANLQNQINTSGGALDAQVSQSGQELALTMVRNGLVFSNAVQARLFEGDHHLDLELGWQGLPQADNIATLDMNQVGAALEVELDLSMDQAAVERSPLAQLVNAYLEQGLLRLDSGRVLLKASYRDGELTVNDELTAWDQLF